LITETDVFAISPAFSANFTGEEKTFSATFTGEETFRRFTLFYNNK